jgi:aryl-alcohol dehydrogenase-like predicted oxidoreductase
VKSDASRREFLQTGIALPAAGLIPAGSLHAATVPLRTLGKTGIRVAPVGFGAGFTPDPSIIARAIDMGVNYYDTARAYGQGNSERLVGAGIRGQREKVVIASKTSAKDKEGVLKDIDLSLQALGTDHTDVYLLHARDSAEAIPAGAVEGLEAIKKAGKTRFIGVSTHDPGAVVDHILQFGKIDVVLITYSYPMGTTRDAAIKKLQDAGIGVVAMKVVVATAGFSMDRGGAAPRPRLTGEAPLAAIKWAIRNPAIATTIPNHANVDQLEMNVRAMSESYTPSDEKLLFAKSEEIRPYYCRMCYECKGQCPKGLPTTDMLRYLAYNDFSGDFYRARENFLNLPREVRSVSCSDCSTCSVKCPNGVHVQERLIRAQQLLA